MNNSQKKITYNNFEWLDLTKPSQEVLNEVAESHQLDPILLTDSLQHGHLPKIENLKDYTFLILRAYSAVDSDALSTIEKLSNKIAFFITKSQLITVHRVDFPFLEKFSSPYDTPMELMLDIINEMVNSFIQPVEFQSDKMDELENLIFLKDSNSISLENLYYQKSKARISKKLLMISQNIIAQIDVEENLKTKQQDIKDTLINSILLYDEVNEDANNLLNTYLSVTARKSNDTMKLLTVFSAFFLPLTFIAGIYGMNFDNIPELHWEMGYFLILSLMAVVSLIIYIWFKKKKII
ncbi:MAG: CorA family divalent cation transporter [Anditalea sp.]